MSGISENNLIEKSKSLVWAKFRDYTSGELRLLEVYLSRINPRDPESSRVEFTLSEYRDLLGLKSLDVRKLRSQIDHFLGNTVAIPIDREKGTFETFVLFTRAKVDFDMETRSHMVSISCNPDLRPIFFDIAESGYVRYRLRYTARMKSQYSILLYSILRDWLNMDGKVHEIGLKKLREQLGATEASYDVYKNFRKRVLDVAVDEINNVSDIAVSYEPVLVSRKAVSIKFKPRLKAEENMIESTASEVRPVQQKKRSGAYEDIDWSKIAPELDKTECIGIAKMVAKRIRQEHPLVKSSKRKAAVADTIKSAYNAVLKGREPWPDNPAGYLYSVLNQDGAIANYLPYTYEV